VFLESISFLKGNVDGFVSKLVDFLFVSVVIANGKNATAASIETKAAWSGELLLLLSDDYEAIDAMNHDLNAKFFSECLQLDMTTPSSVT
jgi:hypothetical protein